MADDIEVISDPTDIEFFVNDETYTAADVMLGVESVLKQIEETDDFEIGSNALRSLNAINRVSGWAAARLCHGMATKWVAKGNAPEDFIDFMLDTTPLSTLTITRYMKAWEGRQYVLTLMGDKANEIDEVFASQPLKNGIALGQAVAQGYELTEEQAEKLVTTRSNSEFLKLIRKIKGKPERKGTLTLYLELDGTIRAWQDEKSYVVGYLEVKSKNKTVKQAIERIKTGSGLIEKRG